jgi:hypothetical protein
MTVQSTGVWNCWMTTSGFLASSQRRVVLKITKTDLPDEQSWSCRVSWSASGRLSSSRLGEKRATQGTHGDASLN